MRRHIFWEGLTEERDYAYARFDCINTYIPEIDQSPLLQANKKDRASLTTRHQDANELLKRARSNYREKEDNCQLKLTELLPPFPARQK